MNDGSSRPPLELWGGVECTRNRVGDRTFDQLDRTGHADRLDDLDLIASTGVRAVRYPVLWERVAPTGLDDADWSWADERLRRLRDLGIRPVVGLLHHGSGPPDTSLLDPGFPSKFARYAEAFANRYPWIEDYAPINEPLTTARFSGLYGHWHPHDRDERTMTDILVRQCVAVAGAMRAIERVNPGARLIANEDVATVQSTRTMAYEAAFQNERRWLTYDLLCGRVDRSHPMWERLAMARLERDGLGDLAEDPRVPDALGVDYYVTSERFLDERVERYPDRGFADDGRHTFVDIEAVRVCERLSGWAGTLRQVWDRYGLPIAVTEAHLAGHREDQVRWLRDVWDAAVAAREEGIDVRAVTAWSMFGACDWDSLVTVEGSFYEPGAFDVRGPTPRATAVATQLRALAGLGEPPAVVTGPGWWDRPDRFLYPPVPTAGTDTPTARLRRLPSDGVAAAPPILVIGGSGRLGSAFVAASRSRGLACVAPGRETLDLLDAETIDAVLRQERPWAVVVAAGVADARVAEAWPTLVDDVNATGTAAVAERCAAADIRCVVFSSDHVFDATPGVKDEDAEPQPRDAYGRSKMRMEQLVAASAPPTLVIRCGELFGLIGDGLDGALRSLERGGSVSVMPEAASSATFAPALVDAVLDLCIDGASGVWHLCHDEAVTPLDLARRAAEALGLDPGAVVATTAADLAPPGPTLVSRHGRILPSLDEALAVYAARRSEGRLSQTA
ncbi:MAG: family 1 glycosylhydrolase [Actinomycetota bacterium]